MAEIFKDILPSILVTKKHVLDDEKDYNAFLVNRGLSYHVDCILHVAELNRLHWLPAAMQYAYALNSIRAYKRKFVPWVKKETLADIELVQEYYGLSKAKARDALRILTADQLDEIRIRTDKGGVSKNVDRRGHGRGAAKSA